LNLSIDVAEFDFVLLGINTLKVFIDLLAHSAFQFEFVYFIEQLKVMRPEEVSSVLLNSDAALLEGWDQWVTFWEFWNVVWFLLAESNLFHSEVVNSHDTLVVLALVIITIDADLSFKDPNSASVEILKSFEFAKFSLAELSIGNPITAGLRPVVEVNAFIWETDCEDQPWNAVLVAV